MVSIFIHNNINNNNNNGNNGNNGNDMNMIFVHVYIYIYSLTLFFFNHFFTIYMISFVSRFRFIRVYVFMLKHILHEVYTGYVSILHEVYTVFLKLEGVIFSHS